MALIALKAFVSTETRRRIRVRVAESDDENMTIGKYLTSLVDADWATDHELSDANNGGEAA